MLMLLALILLGVGWFFAGWVGMTAALGLAILINFLSFWYSDKIVLKMYKAHPFENKELDHILDDLSREAKLPKPRLYLVPKDVPNAFATGRGVKTAVIGVTRGLLDLDRDEIEGVLAHEMAHIKNRDILFSAIAATMGTAVAYLAQMGYWMLFLGGRNRRGEGNVLALVLMVVFAPIAALLIKLAVSRTREYYADFTGVMFTKNPHALASALKKIANIAKAHPVQGSAATSHMWIVNPFHRDWFTVLFSTHPPVEKRVKKLEILESKI